MAKTKLKYQDAGEVEVTGADNWNIPLRFTPRTASLACLANA